MSKPLNISNSTGNSYRPQISSDGKNVYMIWQDTMPGNSDIFFVKTDQSGNILNKIVNLSNNKGSSAFPRLALSDSNVYVTWYDYSPGQSDVFFAKNKNGEQFETVNLSNNINASYNPRIAVQDNYVYVVWNDGGRSKELDLWNQEKRIVDIITGQMEILFARSEDLGNTFSIINISKSQALSWNPRILAEKNNVYVAWNEETVSSSDIFFAKSTDHGRTFSDTVNVSNSNGKAENVHIAQSDENLYLIWKETVGENSDVFFIKSGDGGNSFREPINLSNSIRATEIGRDTQLAVYKNNVYVVWFDNTRGNFDVFLSKSQDYGESFDNPINLSRNEGKSELPQIVIYQENVFVVWNDDTGGNNEIFFRQSNDMGKTFGSIENLSHDSSESLIFVMGPQIATTQNNAYIVWQNATDDGGDLLLQVIEQKDVSPDENLIMKTTNELLNIELGMDKLKLEQDRPVMFTLRFIDPTTGNNLERVNYSFVIEDADGNKIVQRVNQHSETGLDIQNSTFANPGSFTIFVQVDGLGTDSQYDTKFSGSATALITVIPEFHNAVLITLTLAIALTIIAKSNKLNSLIQNKN